MKILTRFLALAALAVILGSCSFAIGALNHRKSRVVASAIWHGRSTAPAPRTVRSATAARTLSPYVAKRRSLPARPAGSVARSTRPAGSARSAAPAVSRDISASTDIDYITYAIVNLDPGSGEPDIQDYLDPYYPYIDVFLTPGQNYRITVDVTLLSGSFAATAGASVGLGSGYGDSADIAVPEDGSDVWVDMLIHPLGGIVIKNQATGTQVTYVNPTTLGVTTTAAATTTGTPTPSDKFFYTSDLLLYYFNYSNNAVYQWTDIAGPVDTTAAFAGTDVSGSFHIDAVCPDPVYAGWFYVVGDDSGTWAVYWVNYDPAGFLGPTTPDWIPTNDITADLELVGTTVSVTGVAADPYGFAYVTFYNTAGGNPLVSGMVEFDTYYGGPAIEQFIPDTTAGWTSADSVFTDVMYGGSNVYVLASPNTTVGSVINTGTADIFAFDIYFTQLSTNPSPVAQSYGGVVALGTGSSLTLPNRFAGMIQGGTLFVSQANFAAAGPEVLSGVSLDLRSVTSVP